MKTNCIFCKTGTEKITDDQAEPPQLKEKEKGEPVSELSPKHDYYQEFKNNKILILENDEMSALLIESLLKKYFIPYTLCTKEKNALMEFENQNFELIILGVNEPELPWEDLLTKVNRFKGVSGHPHVIGLTCLITGPLFMNEDNGFDDVLVKPFKEEEFIKVVSKYISLSGEKNIREFDPENYERSFDLEELNKISNNDQEFVVKMLKKFMESASECEHDMASALSEKDEERLKKIAHKNIPSYSLMGIKDLAVDLRFIEQNATKGYAEIKDPATHVVNKTKEVISDIEDYLLILETNKN